MLIAQHNGATTIPVTRLALQQVKGTGTAIQLGLNLLREWRQRTAVHDASHTGCVACKLRAKRRRRSWSPICAFSAAR